jgi:hypothetical protein
MKKILSIINIVVPFLLFGLLFFFNPGTNFIYIMMMSLFVGWLIPYFNLLITGLSIHRDKHSKLTLIFNIFNVLLNILLLFLIVLIMEKSFIIFIVEYSIMLVISIINIIYLKKRVDIDTIDEKNEYKRIKQIKKETDGVIK